MDCTVTHIYTALLQGWETSKHTINPQLLQSVMLWAWYSHIYTHSNFPQIVLNVSLEQTQTHERGVMCTLSRTGCPAWSRGRGWSTGWQRLGQDRADLAKAARVTQALMVLQATAGEPWKSSYPSHTWVLVKGAPSLKMGMHHSDYQQIWMKPEFLVTLYFKVQFLLLTNH